MNWQPIFGYESKYLVSDTGLVKTITGQLVGQWKNDQGYMIVRLSGPRQQYRVHRLVASAFIANVGGLPAVNHIDFDRSNNNASNLEWCTQKQNLDHSLAAGRMRRNYWKGKRSPNAFLGDDAAQSIRLEYASGGTSWSELGRKCHISKRTIGRIVREETYV